MDRSLIDVSNIFIYVYVYKMEVNLVLFLIYMYIFLFRTASNVLDEIINLANEPFSKFT